MNEYNQCQTQLKQLYSAGLQGAEPEFVAYRILYYVYLQGNEKYSGGSGDLAYIMMGLSDANTADAYVQHALAIRKAIQLENYHTFFKLYKQTPNLGKCILEPMLDTWRFRSLQRIAKAVKPQVSVAHLAKELGFDDIEDAIEFLRKVGGVLVPSPTASSAASIPESGDSNNSITNIESK